MARGRQVWWSLFSFFAAVSVSAASARAVPAEPSIVLISVDTLRADRLSGYGYDRPTSPVMDRLLDSGWRFDAARTVEPLTAPAVASLVTALDPHVHGSTRNGLRVRQGLPSLPKRLAEAGYRTAAFVGNWTLRDKLSGLGEHFDIYEEVLNKRRWWGLLKREAGAAELNDRALEWVAGHRRTEPATPFMLWVHYTEPQAPYKLHRDFTDRLGIETRGGVEPADRYDTEVAFVDHAIGRLLDGLAAHVPAERMLIVLTSDHGESLGEHDYWGHGRNLHEPSLRIPLAIVWKGRIEPQRFRAPALISDIAPTVLGLLGLPAVPAFGGFDWTPVAVDGNEPVERVTRYQAHRGAVLTRHDSELARRSGLLAVGLIAEGQKTILRTKSGQRMRFDLPSDPAEIHDLAEHGAVEQDAVEQDALEGWFSAVTDALGEMDVETPAPLDDESIERLRALGYAD